MMNLKWNFIYFFISEDEGYFSCHFIIAVKFNYLIGRERRKTKKKQQQQQQQQQKKKQDKKIFPPWHFSVVQVNN